MRGVPDQSAAACCSSKQVKKPQRLSFEEAAGVPLTSLTAYTCLLKTAKLTAGQRVLINGGTGSVGIWATQIAKAVGCFTVATCSEASFGLVKDLGADEVVDYKKDLYNTLAEKYGSTDTQRFDVVFDVSLLFSRYARRKWWSILTRACMYTDYWNSRT